MTQTGIPFLFMRGGTSRGPYFNRADLPDDLDRLAQVLIAVVGSGHPLNIDGIGGGNAVTTKVAMLSRSDDDWADVDYFFAQVSVKDGLVDFKPTCGNILSGVGAAAIEMGLHPVTGPETKVRIRAVNTGAQVVAQVQTPDGAVSYDGDAAIDGVPGTAAPVALNFMKVAGSSTGAFLPTGALRDTFDGVEVTCMDVAMPMVIARADAFGLTGHETREDLDANGNFFARMESVRIQAGAAMGMGDVTKSVTPKFGLLAPAQNGGTIATRYFMPWTTHPTMAVTGSQCLASCALTPGTVADGLLSRPSQAPAQVTLEHPMGLMDVLVDYDMGPDGFAHKSAGLVRTCRKLAAGDVFVPKSVWTQ
ncbi:MAG: 4-oxalomesaconate tautomerase [Pseudomonadota bacterium]